MSPASTDSFAALMEQLHKACPSGESGVCCDQKTTANKGAEALEWKKCLQLLQG